MSLKRINKGKVEIKSVADDRYVVVVAVIVVSRRRL
jgi:hypothetical protein